MELEIKTEREKAWERALLLDSELNWMRNLLWEFKVINCRNQKQFNFVSRPRPKGLEEIEQYFVIFYSDWFRCNGSLYIYRVLLFDIKDILIHRYTHKFQSVPLLQLNGNSISLQVKIHHRDTHWVLCMQIKINGKFTCMENVVWKM